MKLHELVQFKSKIEKKRNLFELPSLPDSEWEYMLKKAKSIKESNIYDTHSYSSFMYSKKMSLALSMAIIVALVISFFNTEFLRGYKSFKSEGVAPHITQRVNVPSEKISNNSFI